jgi:hypothetical protein
MDVSQTLDHMLNAGLDRADTREATELAAKANPYARVVPLSIADTNNIKAAFRVIEHFVGPTALNLREEESRANFLKECSRTLQPLVTSANRCLLQARNSTDTAACSDRLVQALLEDGLRQVTEVARQY